MVIRFIPEYYVITDDEYRQECHLKGVQPEPEMLQLLRDARQACAEYAARVDAVVREARTILEPFESKQILYSRTWGK